MPGCTMKKGQKCRCLRVSGLVRVRVLRCFGSFACVYVSVYHGAEAGFGNLGVSRLFRFQDFNLNIRFS